jgi:hypothetical protein
VDNVLSLTDRCLLFSGLLIHYKKKVYGEVSLSAFRFHPVSEHQEGGSLFKATMFFIGVAMKLNVPLRKGGGGWSTGEGSS